MTRRPPNSPAGNCTWTRGRCWKRAAWRLSTIRHEILPAGLGLHHRGRRRAVPGAARGAIVGGGSVARRLEGLVAVDGGAMHGAAVRKIVRDRVVMGIAVVPEGDVIDTPAPPHRKLRLPDVRKQEGEQHLAFPWLQLVDVRRKSLVDE